VVPGRLGAESARVATVNRFVDAMRAAGVSIDVTHFPEGTRTAKDAAAAIGCDVGAIVKSLVFVVDGVGAVLALTSGANRVDLERLGRHFGGDARQATPQEARDATGYAVGGTPPFGHPAQLPTVCDPALLRFDEVWAAAGTPETVFPLAPAQLVALSGADVLDVTTV
jgi:prolyl-tRNA editing enzyme YbaK/EbsC (Cys-tRNA(Pro) deacylase)